MHFNVCV